MDIEDLVDLADTVLAHHGVRGMKWGVRHDGPTGVSKSTSRIAKKDAQEFARAKMFYGEGAGTRRKLIKGTVEDRKKRDASYAKAFNHHLANQDMSKHASKAIGERSSKDRRNKTKKTAGYLARRTTGEMGTQAAFTAVALSGAAFASSPKARAFMKSSYHTVKNSHAHKQGAKVIADFLKNHG